jgi:hypothetical protein
MDIVNVRMMDRPSGQPASEDCVERERMLAAKAEAIAKLKAVRVANECPSSKPKRRKKSALKD